MGMCRSPSTLGPWPRPAEEFLRKQNRRQPLARVDGDFVHWTPGVEQLHELFARGVLVPFAIALHDGQEMIGGLRLLALGVERDSEIVARLMIERVGGDLLFEFRNR